MPAFDSLDSWFDKGFKVRRTPAARAKKSASRDARRSSSGGGLSAKGGYVPKASSKATNARAVLKKAPEVMVKITGSSSGTKSLKNHLEYISRNGEIGLDDESGQCLDNIKLVRGVVEQNKAAGMAEETNKKEFLHVMFSMPKGTPAEAMKVAVKEFCEAEFSNRRYVLALHQDTDNPHVHVCVATQDIDRADEPRLSPRKNDIFRWRQGFAEKLREAGVDAAASHRSHRSNYRKAENGVVRQIRADNPSSPVFNKGRAEERSAARVVKAMANPAKAFVGAPRPPRVPRVLDDMGQELKAAIASKTRPENPAAEKITASRAATFEKWQEVAAALHAEGDSAAKLAQDMAQRATVEPKSKMQELYDIATAGKGKKQDFSQER